MMETQPKSKNLFLSFFFFFLGMNGKETTWNQTNSTSRLVAELIRKSAWVALVIFDFVWKIVEWNRQKNLRDCRGRCSDCNWFASQLEQRTFGLAPGPHRSIAPPTFLSFSSSSSYYLLLLSTLFILPPPAAAASSHQKAFLAYSHPVLFFFFHPAIF